MFWVTDLEWQSFKRLQLVGSSRPEPDVHIRFDERPDRTKAANQPY
jgi:hypothetical protein